MKKILLLSFFIGLTFLCSSCQKEESGRILHIYNWGDYIDMDTVRQFEKETGIEVVYDTYASNEDMYVKIKQDSDPYDVIVPSEYMVERMIREDMLQPLDYSKIDNAKLLDQRLLDKEYDPGNKYSLPYFWGTLGIVVNKVKVTEPVDSWSILWDENYKGEIIMYNSQRDSIAVALAKLGYSMNSRNHKELNEAKKALIKQKPLVYAYLADDGRDVMSQGDAALSVMYSGDAAMMIDENSDLDYIIPKEGTNLWYDCFAVPRNAKNPSDAMLFINFMSRPDIAAINAEYSVGYASPIPEAIEMLPEEIKNDSLAYPNIDDLPPTEVYRDLEEWAEVYDRIWTEVTAQ